MIYVELINPHMQIITILYKLQKKHFKAKT